MNVLFVAAFARSMFPNFLDLILCIETHIPIWPHQSMKQKHISFDTHPKCALGKVMGTADGRICDAANSKSTTLLDKQARLHGTYTRYFYCEEGGIWPWYLPYLHFIGRG
ncbi:unnamed protein product, partial [Prunus brigantina]